MEKIEKETGWTIADQVKARIDGFYADEFESNLLQGTWTPTITIADPVQSLAATLTAAEWQRDPYSLYKGQSFTDAYSTSHPNGKT